MAQLRLTFAQKLQHSTLYANNNQLFPWPERSLNKILPLPQESRFTLYVYDDSPFSKAKFGRTIQLSLYPGDALLVSKKSGSKVDTRSEDDAVCLLYRGRPVGVIFFGKSHVERAYKRGIQLQAKATVGKQLPSYGNIRELTLHLPYSQDRTRHLIDNYELMRKIPGSAKWLRFNEWDEEDYEQIKGRNRWTFETARFEYLPVPKGSTAKPHILASSADGRKIFRLTARNPAYKDLAAALESSNHFIVFAHRRVSLSDDVGYSIELAHW